MRLKLIKTPIAVSPSVAGAMAGATLLAAIALFAARTSPLAPPARLLAWLLPLPQTYAALADQALADRPADYAAARAATERELSLAPSHAEAWLRLAFIETAGASSRLTPSANNALKQSYRLAPIDVRFASWRLKFILEHWESADAEVRAAAMDEIGALWRETAFRRSMRALLISLVNPSGQMALSFKIASLERQPPRPIAAP